MAVRLGGVVHPITPPNANLTQASGATRYRFATNGARCVTITMYATAGTPTITIGYYALHGPRSTTPANFAIKEVGAGTLATSGRIVQIVNDGTTNFGVEISSLGATEIDIDVSGAVTDFKAVALMQF